MILFIVGTFNSGKTTLFNNLKKEFEILESKKKLSDFKYKINVNSIYFFSEQARKLAEQGGQINKKINTNSLNHFVYTIYNNIQKHNNDSLLIFDDSPITVNSYALLNEKLINLKKIKSYQGFGHEIVYLFVKKKRPIVNDGIRMLSYNDQNKIEYYIKYQIYHSENLHCFNHKLKKINNINKSNLILNKNFDNKKSQIFTNLSPNYNTDLRSYNKVCYLYNSVLKKHVI